MQFAEKLTDRQAADAVRARLDWKYALGLELEDAGFDFSVLSEFRQRLLDGAADPEWIKKVAQPEWFERYGTRFTSFRLPRSQEKREALAEGIGADGYYLLEHIYDETAPQDLRYISAVDTLRLVWLQPYVYEERDGQGRLRWRKSGNQPPAALMICSPYDLEARHSSKRGGQWRGYKVQLTEACDEDGVLAILNVVTTVATEQDFSAVEPVHAHLEQKQLLPAEHFVDSAYIAAAILVSSEDRYGVDLLGPIRPNRSWQADEEAAYDIARFEIDWAREVAICPQGKPDRHGPRSWKPAKRLKNRTSRSSTILPMVQVHFHLSISVLNYWLAKYRRETTRATAPERGAFVEITPRSAPSEQAWLEVVYPQGVRLRLFAPIEPAYVARLLALGGCPA